MEPFLGEIRLFAGNFAPRGWALANGQLLSIQQNTALFALLGTFYGGNGVSNFALPNMQSRFPLHVGQGPGLTFRTIGEIGGTETTTLLANNLPLHTHSVRADGNGGGKTSPTSNLFGTVSSGATEKMYSVKAPGVAMNATMLQPAGSNLPFSNIKPYLAVTFMVALIGIFPSRN